MNIPLDRMRHADAGIEHEATRNDGGKGMSCKNRCGPMISKNSNSATLGLASAIDLRDWRLSDTLPVELRKLFYLYMAQKGTNIGHHYPPCMKFSCTRVGIYIPICHPTACNTKDLYKY